MPDQDLLAALGESSDRLARKAMESVEICQVYAAAMGVLEDTGMEKGARAITVSKAEMTNKRIIAHVTFIRLELPARTAAAPEAAGSFLAWARKDAYRLYHFMRANPTTILYLEDLVRLVDAHARHKGIPFEEVKFAEVPAPFLDKDGYLVIEIEDKAEKQGWLEKVSKLWRGNR